MYGIFLMFRLLAFWDSYEVPDNNTTLKSGSIAIWHRCGQREESGPQRSQTSVECNENKWFLVRNIQLKWMQGTAYFSSLSNTAKNLLVALRVKILFTAKVFNPELKSDITTAMLFFLMHETCSCTWKNPTLFTAQGERNWLIGRKYPNFIRILKQILGSLKVCVIVLIYRKLNFFS